MNTHRNHVEAPKEVPVSFRLTQDEHEAFQRIAAREHRSMTGQLRYWIASDDADLAEAA